MPGASLNNMIPLISAMYSNHAMASSRSGRRPCSVGFGQALVYLEVAAESTNHLTGATQRRPLRDIAVAKLTATHTIAYQLGYMVDVHDGQLRAPPTGALDARRVET